MNKITILPNRIAVIESDTKYPLVDQSKDVKAREKKIKAILKRGNIACMTNVYNGIVKHVTTWDLDAGGDLIATYSTGMTKYVAWDSDQYEISEIKKK